MKTYFFAAAMALLPTIASAELNTPPLLDNIKWSECYEVACYISDVYPVVSTSAPYLGSTIQRGPKPRPANTSDLCASMFGAAAQAQYPGMGIQGVFIRIYDTGTTSGICLPIDDQIGDPPPNPTEPDVLGDAESEVRRRLKIPPGDKPNYDPPSGVNDALGGK